MQAVFFDLYNTLARFWPPREQLQAKACAEFGLTVSPEGITQGYAKADAFMASENAQSPVRGRNAQEMAQFFAEYERLVLEGTGLQVDSTLAARIWERIRQFPYDLALFEDVIPSLQHLKALGLTLGLLSNVNRDGRKLCDSLGLTTYLDFVVTSQDVGSEKPHPPMFLAALERAKVAPHQAMHIGDQYTSDVVGARNVGIQPVLMDRYGVVREPMDVPVVHNLGELEELLKLAPRP